MRRALVAISVAIALTACGHLQGPTMPSQPKVAHVSASVRAFRVQWPTATIPKPLTWRELVYSYHDWDAPLMMRVSWCESRWEPQAIETGSDAVGLFQVLGGSTDALANVRQAHALWLEQGYSAWDSSRGCWS